jgi:Transcriptional regulator, AbiEi antitoxin
MLVHARPVLPPTLAALAARQGGVFTTAQAQTAGYVEDEIRRNHRNGLWTRLRRGVYAERALTDGLDDVGLHRLHMAALTLHIDDRAVASHETAAVVQGLPLLLPDLSQLHVTRDDLGASRREAGVQHHAASLPAEQVSNTSGLRHTAAARTVVDIARRTTLARGVAACDSALRFGISRRELQQLMEFCSTWPGARGASRAVAFGDGRAANPGESYSRVVLAELGLPTPELQVESCDGRGLVGVVDFYLKRHRTVGEFDGKLKYKVPEGADPQRAGETVFAEKVREDRLRALGLEVVRWTWDELFHPDLIRARFLQAFERSARRAA